MDPDTTRSLRELLTIRPVASLATLHHGEPAQSMVPFVLPPGDTRLFIHVSALATHTRDLQHHARVSLLVMAEPDDQTLAQALPRVALQADASMLERDGSDWLGARAAYLQRFPQSAPIFDLGDFSLVALQPVAARLVAGFGRAHSLVGAALAAWLRG